MKGRSYLIILGLLFAGLPLSGQPGGIPPQFRKAVAPVEEGDSSAVFYFYEDNPGQEFPVADTLLDGDFQQYDPTRQTYTDWGSLGIVGTPNRPLFYQSYFHKGFEYGWRQFDLYKLQPGGLRYYKLQKAYTKIHYDQGSQTDGNLMAQFSRSFSQGLSISADYRHLYNLNTTEKRIHGNAVYEQPKAGNTIFAIGIWYHHPSDRYDAFVSYTSNSMLQTDNGGISGDSVFQSDARVATVVTKVTDALTRHNDKTWALTHHYRMFAGKDSVQTRNRAFRLTHQFRYEHYQYKFSDSDADSTYYQNLWTDERGKLRQYVEGKSIENSFYLGTYKPRASKDSSAILQQRDLLEAGLTHRYIQLNQEPRDSQLNNLFLSLRFHFTPSERLRVETYGHYGLLWANRGDYRLSGILYYDFKKLGSLEIDGLHQRYSPSMLEYQAFVSQRAVWKNDFVRTIETSVTGVYTLPWFQFKATGSYHLLNNYIYYDTLATPRQETKPISILQLIVQKDIKVGHFHLDNRVAFQKITENVLRLPEVYTRNSLYYEGKLFKKVLLIRTGFDFRWNTAYYGDTYQPVVGQFHLQNGEEIKPYPGIDFFLTAKVQTFRFLIKLENLYGYFNKSVYYQTAYYPFTDRVFRFGITWKLAQ